MSSGVAWWAGYLVSLAAFVVLGLRDPDTARRSAVWSMTATFAGMALLATLRTLTIGGWFTPGPGFAAWFTVSALLATRGRPTRLAVGTPLDPPPHDLAHRGRRAPRAQCSSPNPVAVLQRVRPGHHRLVRPAPRVTGPVRRQTTKTAPLTGHAADSVRCGQPDLPRAARPGRCDVLPLPQSTCALVNPHGGHERHHNAHHEASHDQRASQMRTCERAPDEPRGDLEGAESDKTH